MRDSVKQYIYKLTTDDGGAPCVVHGLLSLAICKPMIRTTAEEGDVIFGFAANSLHRDNRLVYVAVVNKVIPDGLYYRQGSYVGRPDRIYKARSDGTFCRRSDARFHESDENLHHDLGAFPEYERAIVLLSDEFRYFGPDCPIPLDRYPLVQEFVHAVGRGYRLKYSPELEQELDGFAKAIWRQEQPDPVRSSQKSSDQRSHRGGSCAVVRPAR